MKIWKGISPYINLNWRLVGPKHTLPSLRQCVSDLSSAQRGRIFHYLCLKMQPNNVRLGSLRTDMSAAWGVRIHVFTSDRLLVFRFSNQVFYLFTNVCFPTLYLLLILSQSQPTRLQPNLLSSKGGSGKINAVQWSGCVWPPTHQDLGSFHQE